jgi:SOS response regulatory protein OraA/RecX
MAIDPDDTPKKSAYTVGLRALAQRERSTHDLRRLLTRKDYAPDDIDAALARLVAHGAVDDRRAATGLARRQMRLGRSVSRVRAELLAHGFERALVGEVLDTLGASAHDLGALGRAVARLAPTLTTPEATTKAMQRLYRRGFDLSSIRKAFAEHGTSVDEADTSSDI